jgi:hypothetical protein
MLNYLDCCNPATYYAGLGGEAMRAFLIMSALALAGCASNNSEYARTDGVPVDRMHEQATLAQCKGEGATATVQTGSGGITGAIDRTRKEADVVNACMARNGYVHAQQ